MNRVLVGGGCLLALWLLLPAPTHSLEIWLQWDSNPEPDLAHYLVYKTASRTAPPTSKDLIAKVQTPSYIVEDVALPEHCYFWIRAVDRQGQQSSLAGPLEVQADSTAFKSDGQDAPEAFLIEHRDNDQQAGDPYIDRTLDNDDTVEFVWRDLKDLSGSYRLYLQRDSYPEVFLDHITAHQYLVTPATYGAAYRLRIEVVDGQGQVHAQGVSRSIRCMEKPDQSLVPGQPAAQAQP